VRRTGTMGCETAIADLVSVGTAMAWKTGINYYSVQNKNPSIHTHFLHNESMEILVPNLLVASIFVVFVAAIVQGTMGMGFGQIAASGLIWIDPAMVPTAVIVMGFCVASASAAKELKLIDRKQLQPALIGRVLGTIASVPLIAWAGRQDQFALLFGVLVLVGIGVSLARLSPPLSERTLLIGGTASGVMGTITSIGAPPMGLIYQDQRASEVRSTLNAFFAIGSLVSQQECMQADGWELLLIVDIRC